MPSSVEQWRTFLFVLAIFAIVVGYNLLVYAATGRDSTISVVMNRLFRSCPTLFLAFVFFLGVLVGHLMPTE